MVCNTVQIIIKNFLPCVFDLARMCPTCLQTTMEYAHVRKAHAGHKQQLLEVLPHAATCKLVDCSQRFCAEVGGNMSVSRRWFLAAAKSAGAVVWMYTVSSGVLGM